MKESISPCTKCGWRVNLSYNRSCINVSFLSKYFAIECLSRLFVIYW